MAKALVRLPLGISLPAYRRSWNAKVRRSRRSLLTAWPKNPGSGGGSSAKTAPSGWGSPSTEPACPRKRRWSRPLRTAMGSGWCQPSEHADQADVAASGRRFGIAGRQRGHSRPDGEGGIRTPGTTCAKHPCAWGRFGCGQSSPRNLRTRDDVSPHPPGSSGTDAWSHHHVRFQQS